MDLPRETTVPDRCPTTGKVAHRHYRAALTAVRCHKEASRLRGAKTDVLNVFRCKSCGYFHLGNPDPTAGRSKRRRVPPPEFDPVE